ncbi:MAG: SUMF1/EgtB/PvdO family nonheme iron enzyme [Acidobacteriota bacterium]
MLLRSFVFLVAAGTLGGEWTGFRGRGDSITAARNLPLSWSDRHNVSWKVGLPGYGQSTPVEWNSRIFLTAIEGPKKEKLHVLALDAGSGKVIWRQSYASSRPQETGDRVARAASSPAVDARGVYVAFDSGDVMALTHDGELRWRQNLNQLYGKIENGHDFGSSLRQGGDRLFLHVNHFGPSYLVAMSKATGEKLWRVEFPKEGGWNTPVLVDRPGQPLLLVQRSGGVAAYDPANGALVWEDLRTFSRDSAVPSVTVQGEVAVVPSQNKGGTWALRLSDPKRPLWTAKAATNAFSSPLLTAKRAYFVNSVGALFAVELATGKDLWSTRLGTTTWASAIAAGDRVYFFTGEGVTHIFRDADTMEKLGESALTVDSTVYAVTPIDGALLVRTGTTLTKVANLGQKDPAPPAVSRSAPAPAAEEPPLPPAPAGQPGQVRENAKDGLRLAWIPAGSFRMGCSEGDPQCTPDERPAHTVTLSRGFWMNTTEVTVGAYRKFVAATERAMPAEAPAFNPEWANAALPMTRVSRADAQAYCRWSGGRLPTEAQWEYATRAGTTTPRYGELEAVAWYGDNAGRERIDTERIAQEQRGQFNVILGKNGNQPHAAATKAPNAFGLYDLLGNVWEWTADWHDSYAAGAATDPTGPADGEKRVLRGGSWTFFGSQVRASARLKVSENLQTDYAGFRCIQ